MSVPETRPVGTPVLKESGLPETGQARVVIEAISPVVDGGVFPVKRTVGETVAVEADIFCDGHDAVGAVLLYSFAPPDAGGEGLLWSERRFLPIGNDRWSASFEASREGRYVFAVEAWVDPFLSWRNDLVKWAAAGEDLSLMLRIGTDLILDAAERAAAEEAAELDEIARALQVTKSPGPALEDHATALMFRNAERPHPVRSRTLAIEIDRERARFGAWYEMFPRSASPDRARAGTLRDVASRLPYIAGMGFDVLYLPPVHPIGRSHRKGRDNRPVAGPRDPGSPWAIGSADGGHTTVAPELGGIEDFRFLLRETVAHGMELALDLAFQCSPDHPWIREHPQWFRRRPDGSIRFAENPPKKYEDIVPLDFETEDWQALWEELRRVVLFWIGEGVRIFRVDNPHTKPFGFWRWLIAEIKREHPDVLFLAEALTRPKVMQRLAKIGFSQSYTYFAWRNGKEEIERYLRELTSPPLRDFLRPNLWPNTPDILTEAIQTGGRAGFMVRLVLAATLGASYGIYGPAFELMEDQPLDAGAEEYLDSEKYAVRHWEIDRPESLAPFIAEINRIRRENPALQADRNLVFHPVENPQLLCYTKVSDDRDNAILVAVNLDPHHTQSGWCRLDLGALRIHPEHPYRTHDLLAGTRVLWSGPRIYLELSPEVAPAQICRIVRRTPTERDFSYYM